jgi:hypothetical protein
VLIASHAVFAAAKFES